MDIINWQQGKNFRLVWGGHSGSWLSRDMGDEFQCATASECKEKLAEIKAQLKAIGHKLWFAQVRDMDNNIVFQESGDPYRV